MLKIVLSFDKFFENNKLPNFFCFFFYNKYWIYGVVLIFLHFRGQFCTQPESPCQAVQTVHCTTGVPTDSNYVSPL